MGSMIKMDIFLEKKSMPMIRLETESVSVERLKIRLSLKSILTIKQTILQMFQELMVIRLISMIKPEIVSKN